MLYCVHRQHTQRARLRSAMMPAVLAAAVLGGFGCKPAGWTMYCMPEDPMFPGYEECFDERAPCESADRRYVLGQQGPRVCLQRRVLEPWKFDESGAAHNSDTVTRYFRSFDGCNNAFRVHPQYGIVRRTLCARRY